jgi:DNA-binding IclR family transcriptional regulator
MSYLVDYDPDTAAIMMLDALTQSEGNVKEAARALKVSLSTIKRYIYRLDHQGFDITDKIDRIREVGHV